MWWRLEARFPRSEIGDCLWPIAQKLTPKKQQAMLAGDELLPASLALAVFAAKRWGEVFFLARKTYAGAKASAWSCCLHSPAADAASRRNHTPRQRSRSRAHLHLPRRRPAQHYAASVAQIHHRYQLEDCNYRTAGARSKGLKIHLNGEDQGLAQTKQHRAAGAGSQTVALF